jgi:hypothetical protein
MQVKLVVLHCKKISIEAFACWLSSAGKCHQSSCFFRTYFCAYCRAEFNCVGRKRSNNRERRGINKRKNLIKAYKRKDRIGGELGPVTQFSPYSGRLFLQKTLHFFRFIIPAPILRTWPKGTRVGRLKVHSARPVITTWWSAIRGRKGLGYESKI